MKISWVTDYLALSGAIDDYNQLEKERIDIVINCRAEQHDDFCELSKKGISYYYIPIVDGFSPRIGQIGTFLKIMDFCNLKKRVLVHCAVGQGRSVILAAAWIVKQGMNIENALEQLKRVKEDVSLTKPQEEKLREWHNKMEEKPEIIYGVTRTGVALKSSVIKGWIICPACHKKFEAAIPYGWMLLHRDSVRYVKILNKKNLICAEVGVRAAANAKSILETLDVKKLYLIDPYLPYKSERPEDHIQEELDNWKKKAHEVTKPFVDKVEFIQKTSEEAASQFSDGFFDFIYIDANHSYPYIKRDIELWWPKVKKDGTLAGHDYDENHPGVVRAVEEFRDRHPEIETKHYPNDWYYVRRNE